ncbi:uncharacterized protein LOC132038344 [Lycium ferocissimum]|uniref:uncharacterized protein LOC132038344 n=1 Tax=Lycium ferocissimum TaxID=112874 RepID=UPI00281617FF|nr:uncharacterized protein LOC132038344 [Lycium ferocissimum]
MKQSVARKKRATTSVQQLIYEAARAREAFAYAPLEMVVPLHNQILIGEKKTLENNGEKSGEEEKSGESATKKSSKEEKSGESATQQLGEEEKSGESATEQSGEEEKSGESTTERSGEEEKDRTTAGDMDGNQVREERTENSTSATLERTEDREEQQLDQNDAQSVAIAGSINDTGGGNSKGTGSPDNDSDPNALSVPECVKTISIEKYVFETHLNLNGPYDSRINVRVGFGTQFVEFRKVLIDQGIENGFKKTCFGF